MNLLAIMTGFLQLTIVLLVVALLVRSVRHRSPAVAAKIGTLGLSLGCGVVLLFAFDVPRFIEGSVAIAPASAPQASAVAPAEQTSQGDADANANRQTQSALRQTPAFALSPIWVWLAGHEVAEADTDQGRSHSCVLIGGLFTALLVVPLLGWLAGNRAVAR